MRKIAIEVPEKRCKGCSLAIEDSSYQRYKCPFRHRYWFWFLDDLKPVKACRDAEIGRE